MFPQALNAQDTTGARRLPGRIVIARPDGKDAYRAARTRSATKTDTPLRDIPQAVTAVTRAVIADQSMQGMADVVRYIPGISMGQGEGHRDAPTIRGQSSTADFFVDGVRDDAQYFRDLYNVERVEAVKGSNAMIFGRGGGGGIINRVTKEPSWVRSVGASLMGGSFDHKRAALDLGAPLGTRAASRLNAMHERSAGFRRGTRVERTGVNPELAFVLGGATVARVGYEHFSDDRTVDRGIPSFQGRPAPGDVTRFFGDPVASPSHASVNAAHVTVSSGAIRNSTRYTAYDKFYQNVFPSGAVNTAGTQVNLAGYNSTTGRSNIFNQTDVTIKVRGHSLLVGTEIGRQGTRSFRNTGYFNGSTSTVAVDVEQPVSATPIAFRQSATDADNRAIATVAAAYVQDQLSLGEHWLAVAGVRVDRFAVSFHNNRVGAANADLSRTDRVVSPRLGLIFKPAQSMSLYATQGVSHLPGSGDQFSTLTVTTTTLEPESFTNRELGIKWDANPALSLTAAAYRLDRSRSLAADPADATKVVQTGEQRTSGLELGATGNLTSRWQVVAGFTAQRARITSATKAAKPGATSPLVPDRSASLWNKLRLTPALSVGLGVTQQGDVYAAIDNSVVLPGFTRADAAVYVRMTSRLRAQLNIENVANARYYWTSHGNNNIMPGAPRTLRLSLVAGN